MWPPRSAWLRPSETFTQCSSRIRQGSDSFRPVPRYLKAEANRNRVNSIGNGPRWLAAFPGCYCYRQSLIRLIASKGIEVRYCGKRRKNSFPPVIMHVVSHVSKGVGRCWLLCASEFRVQCKWAGNGLFVTTEHPDYSTGDCTLG